MCRPTSRPRPRRQPIIKRDHGADAWIAAVDCLCEYGSKTALIDVGQNLEVEGLVGVVGTHVCD